MPKLPKLPAELWLVIFDLLIAPSLSPVTLCNLTNFPEISLHLRHPREYAPIEYPYTDLRLVCRAFKDLLGPSPYFFVKNATTPITTTTRAVYIPLHEAPLSLLKRVMMDPYRARRIVTLYVTYTNSRESTVPFDALCKSSRALTGLRNLTLNIFYIHPQPLNFQLWSRLNKAFPLLLCLVLLPALKRLEATPVETAHEPSPVIFEHLQILDAGCIIPPPMLRFPVLRYAALTQCTRRSSIIFFHSPLLESLHLRGIENGALIHLNALQRVPSIGIPMIGEIPPLPPPDYPLYHLCIYAVYKLSPRCMIPWIAKISPLYPTLSRITIDLTMLPEVDYDWVRGLFVDANLHVSGLAVAPASVKGHIIVLERIPVVTRLDHLDLPMNQLSVAD